METWNRLTAARGEGRRRQWWKEEEGISQRTCMNYPWTWTTMWGLTVEWDMGWVEEGKGEKLGQLQYNKQ